MRSVVLFLAAATAGVFPASVAMARDLDGDCFVARMTPAEAVLFGDNTLEKPFLAQLEPAARDALMSRWGEACAAPVADRKRIDDLLFGIQAERATRRMEAESRPDED